MISAIKDWLPITVRNRMALVFAVLALVLFVVWNLLPISIDGPFYRPFEGNGASFIWRVVFDPEVYVYVFKARELDGFVMIYVFIALILHSLLTLMIVPLWRVLSAVTYLRVSFAIMTLVTGFVTFFMTDAMIFRILPSSVYAVFALIVLSMFILSAALFIFTNERILLEEMKLMDEMEHAAANRVLISKKKNRDD